MKLKKKAVLVWVAWGTCQGMIDDSVEIEEVQFSTVQLS